MVVENAHTRTARIPADIAEEFITVAHRIVWCTVATVDTRGRPRGRILHPFWEYGETGLTGWIVTRPSPVKVAHLARTPYATCSYWDPAHDVALADCAVEWIEDTATRTRIWERFRDTPPPLGFDFWSSFPDGPAGGTTSLLRLGPYRVRVSTVDALLGRTPHLNWSRPTAA
ncbi:pyridoxamine 5'-phosphate oxidase family protein [Streptomyces sp. NPDC008141]|uniref:pyridoxamine 5'-phosphate oxidase family protein n=1 Tax=Streptomyces sp. NPDC008141 TaxID=3364815 RepID=UPI0036E846DC